MATQIQWRRGSSAQTAIFTGAVGEATVDTTKNTFVIHDGSTAGGFPLARESALSANAIYLQASYNQANAAFISANSAGVYANGAFASSNTIQTYVTSANANISLLFSYVNTANANITAAFAAANSAGVYANAAFIHANASFSFANTISGGAAIDNVARVLANSAATLSDATDATQNNSITAAFAQANSATATDATQNNSIAAAFTQANSVYLPSVTRLDVTHSGSSAYLLDQYTGNNPELYIRAGETLAFSLNVTGHPFLIRVSNGGPNYNTGLTHVTTTGTVTTGSSAQGQVTGTLYWKVPAELAGNTYVYQCSIHSGMVGNIVIERPNHDFTNITVTAGTYGNATHYGVVSVAANGRVTSVSTFPVVDSSAIAFSIALG